MRPVLFTFFGQPVPSHGVFYVLGFIVCFLVGYYEARRVGIDPEKMLDVGFWLVIGIVIGARLMYVAVEHRYFFEHPARIFYLWEGGMVLYGGVVGLFVSAWLSLKFKKIPWGEGVDVIAQAGTLGLIVGRIGCLLSGCCYGKPTGVAWCVSYRDPHSLAGSMIGGTCVHPTQVYEMILMAVVYGFLFYWSRHKKFSGQLMWGYYIVYPIGRFVVEFFRGDARGFFREPVFSAIFSPLLTSQTYTMPSGGFFVAPYLSTSQILSLIAFAIASAGYCIQLRRAKKRESSPPQ